MEITISLDENNEAISEELISQQCYYMQRDLNEEEVEKLIKTLFLRSLRNHLEIGFSIITAMGGMVEHGSDSWKNFSKEESEEEGFEEVVPFAMC